MIRTLVTFLAATALAGAAEAQDVKLSPGYSRDGAVVVTEAHIPYADLDVATAQGARELLARVDTALDAVCGSSQGADRSAAAQSLACRRDALRGVASRLKSPAVTAAIKDSGVRRLAAS